MSATINAQVRNRETFWCPHVRIETNFSCSSGTILDFSSNTALQGIFLQGNALTGALFGLPIWCPPIRTETKLSSCPGTIPDLSKCTQLRVFNIASNECSGAQPWTILIITDQNSLLFHVPGTIPSFSENFRRMLLSKDCGCPWINWRVSSILTTTDQNRD